MTFFDSNGYNNTQDNPLWAVNPGVHATSIEAGKDTDTIIKNTSGIFFGFLVTEPDTGTPLVYNNASAASGDVVGALAASAPVGPQPGMPIQGVRCDSGITVNGSANHPGMVILWI